MGFVEICLDLLPLYCNLLRFAEIYQYRLGFSMNAGIY